jgi:hypothetical protein
MRSWSDSEQDETEQNLSGVDLPASTGIRNKTADAAGMLG